MDRVILKSNDLTFTSRPRIVAGKYTVYSYSDIMWSPYREHWRLAKKICLMELFNTKRLESYEYIRLEEVARMVASIFQKFCYRSACSSEGRDLVREQQHYFEDGFGATVFG
ncbi:hypothetical protein SUGI_0177230 [Cryptomeria japonica]|nr:hypothetical protein SUGI_0177230 [Cryptomeria japonica]